MSRRISSPIDRRDPRIDYALSVLLGTEEVAELPLEYGNKAAKIQIIPSNFFDTAHGERSSLPSDSPECLDGIPVLYGRPLVQRSADKIICHADLVASAYFLLTRYEEWVRPDARDQHGRFIGQESLAYRAGFLHRPIVDEYSKLLREWCRELGISLPYSGRQFRVLLTHDVDSLGAKNAASTVAQTARRAADSMKYFCKNSATSPVTRPWWKHPHNNISEVATLDHSLIQASEPERVESIFFFLAQTKHRRNRHLEYFHRPRYNIHARTAKNAIRAAESFGATIGLHSSYAAGLSPELISTEHAALESVTASPVRWNRHHYLGLREIGDLSRLSDAGLTNDSTLGFADCVGFRLGTCQPVEMFDPIRQERTGVTQWPLIAMDCTLSAEVYMGLSPDEAYRTVCQLADTVAAHRGQFVILWHNELLCRSNDYHRPLYEKLLTYLASLLAGSVDPEDDGSDG